ncbi:MAG: MFS transporter [Acidobacteria bacterium]|jgi:MFS family permease|nr:MAG: MFS transporter [Acidobacteriota bacterium]
MFRDFTPQERRVVLSITFAVAVRMLGLFLLLPVLSPYLKTLEGANPQLIGLAIGIYGLAQALLQIPFGYLSDLYGRKPIIVFGMLTYVLGSVLAGLAGSIGTMIVARFIQGFGAVSSAMTALSADLTRPQVRTRAFASIGASIGLVFTFSIISAPLIAGKLGVPFLFYFTALLSLLAVLLVAIKVPEPARKEREIVLSLRNIYVLLLDKDQLFLNFSIALLHAYLVGIFTMVPYELVYLYNLPKPEHWKIYLPSLLLSLLFMVPAILLAEKRKKFREVFSLGVALMLFAFLSYEFERSIIGAVLMIFFFLLGFHLLEPLVPSLLTKISHRDMRGLALGLFNTSQFVGAFAGGIWGGYALKHGHLMLTSMGVVLALLWLALSLAWFSRDTVLRES